MRLADIPATMPTDLIADCLKVLDREPATMTEDERLIRALLLSELEQRHPEIDAATLAWAENLDDPRTYVAVALDALDSLKG